MKKQFLCQLALTAGLFAGMLTAYGTVVSTTDDSGAGSLRQAVLDTPAGGTVTFDNALDGASIAIGNHIVIAKNLTIDASALASGIILDGNWSGHRIFSLTAATANTFNNLTFSNAYAAISSGGGMWITAGATVTINQSTFTECKADHSGGGIRLESGNLTINDSTLSGNSALAGDGIGGGGIHMVSGTLTINNSTLSGNVGTTYGGGISMDSGTLLLNNSTLSENAAIAGSGSPGEAGGIDIYGGTVTMNNSIVAGNSAAVSDNINGPFTGANNLTSGNPLLAPLGDYGGPTQTMPPLPGSPAIDAGNNALTSSVTDQRGAPRVGGVAVEIGSVEIHNSIVVQNTNDFGIGSLRNAIAITSSGETITFTNTLNGGTITLTSGELLINKSLSIDASALSGGIIIDGDDAFRILRVEPNTLSSTIDLKNLTLTRGFASGAGVDGLGGGILYLSSSSGSASHTLNLTDCTISECEATHGGGISSWSFNLNITGCEILNNSASLRGGGIDMFSGTLELSTSTVSGNTTPGLGGGVYIQGQNHLIDRCTFSNNHAGGDGGGVWSRNKLICLNSTFTQNSAQNGGALYTLSNTGLYEEQSVLRHNTITGNVASESGGGLFFGDEGRVENTILAGNTAPSFPDLEGTYVTMSYNLIGGNPELAPLGDYGGPTQTMPPLQGSTVLDRIPTPSTELTDQRGQPRSQGYATDIGAVESVPFPPPIVMNNADTGTNSLRNAIDLASPGDTIYFDAGLSGQTILLVNQLVINKSLSIDASNLADGIILDGGDAGRILHVDPNALNSVIPSTINLNNLTLTSGKNAGVDGGGGILYGSISSASVNHTLSLTNCTISDCETAGYGGGILAYNKLSISGCEILNNYASSGGGGILMAGAVLELSTSTVSGNTTPEAAGGVHLWNDDDRIDRCTFSDNHAGQWGGGVISAHQLICLNSTFTQNSAQRGGALYLSSGSDLEILHHNTITGNMASESGGGLFLDYGGHVRVENTIIAGNTAPSFPDFYKGPTATTNVINNLIGGTPELAPLGDYGGPTQTMPPLPESPAFNPAGSGIISSLLVDQRGFPRLSGSSIDTGAVEVDSALVATLWGQDIDGDGSPYGVELALGTDPDVSDPGHTNNLSGPHFSGGDVLINFGLNPDAIDNATLVLQHSTNLTSGAWFEVYRFDGTTDTTPAGVNFNRSANAIQIIDQRNAGPHAYYRFEAELPAP